MKNSGKKRVCIIESKRNSNSDFPTLGLMSRVFVNGLENQSSISGRVMPKT